MAENKNIFEEEENLFGEEEAIEEFSFGETESEEEFSFEDEPKAEEAEPVKENPIIEDNELDLPGIEDLVSQIEEPIEEELNKEELTKEEPEEKVMDNKPVELVEETKPVKEENNIKKVIETELKEEDNSFGDIFEETEKDSSAADLFGVEEIEEKSQDKTIEEEDEIPSFDLEEKTEEENIIEPEEVASAVAATGFLAKFKDKLKKKDKKESEKEDIKEDKADLSKLNVLKDSNKTENKPVKSKGKKIAEGLSIFAIAAIFGWLYFPTSEEPKQNNTSKTEQVKTNGSKEVESREIKLKDAESIKEDKIQFKQELKLEDAVNDTNVLDAVKLLERKVKDLEKGSQNRGMTDSDYLEKKFALYKEFNGLTFKGKVVLEDNSILTVDRSSKTFKTMITNDTSSYALDDTIPLVIENGIIMKYVDTDIVYIIFRDLENIYKSTIWELSVMSGLQQVLQASQRNIILKDYLDNEKNPKENLFIQNYVKQVVLIGKSGEITKVMPFKDSSNKLNLSELGKIVQEEEIIGYRTNQLNFFRISEGKMYKNDSLIQTDYSSLYEYKWTKIEDTETKEHKDYIITYKGSSPISTTPLSSVNYVTFASAKVANGDSYIYKNGHVYKVNSYLSEEDKGKGLIVSEVENNTLTGKVVILETQEVKPVNLYKYNGKTLFSKENSFEINGNTVIVKNISVLNRAPLPEGNYDLKDFTLTTDFKMSYKNQNIGFITKIQENVKVGVELETENFLIKLRTKEDYNIYSLSNSKDLTEPNLRFELDYKNKEIIVRKSSNLQIDTEKKTVNGIKYEKMERVDNRVILFGTDGSIIEEIIEEKDKLILKEKIKDLKIIKGNVFDYFYSLKTEEGTVESSDFGSLAIKYNTDNNPFPEFLTSKKKLEIGQEKIKEVKSDTLKISEMYSKNFFINNLEFIGSSVKEKLTIIDREMIEFNGTKFLLKIGIFNNKRNLFELVFQDNLDKRDIKTIESAKLSYPKSVFYVKDIKVSFPNFFDKKNLVYVLESKKGQVIKKGDKYFEVNSKKIDFFENRIYYSVLRDGAMEEIYVDMNELVQLNDSVANTLQNEYLQITKEEAVVKDIESKNTLDINILKSELAKLNEELKVTNTQEVKKLVFNMSQKEIEKTVEDAKVADFTFEIGSTIDFLVKESINLVEGIDNYKVLGDLKSYRLRDRSGNVIRLKNPKVVLAAVGDFSKNTVTLFPEVIVFNDENDIKRKIDIPVENTRMRFVEVEDNEEYITDGVPARKVMAKLKNLNTMIMLKTVQGVLDFMTASEDPLSSLLSAGTQDQENVSASAGEAAASGTAEGLNEIVEIMKAQAEKEKDVLITEPGIEGTSVFVKELEVFFED